MSHGLFDCVGLRLPDWDAVTGFVHEHWDELRGYPTPDGWFNATWRDPSGAKVVVNVNGRGEVEAIPGFAGGTTARITDIGWVEGTDALAAYVVDDQGAEVTRLCAACDQWRFLPGVSCEETFEAIITGLALKVRIYQGPDAFRVSPDADMSPLSEPLTLPNGVVLDRLPFGSESFVPGGMFQQPWNPMAFFSAIVARSWTKTVEATGDSFHVARVNTVGALGIYLCWPAETATLAEPGNTVYAEAYLTAMVPEIWRRQASGDA
jgi:hypothetical protein